MRLGYISMKRGVARHVVVHADLGCVCVMELCMGGGTSTGVFEKRGQGSDLTGS